MAYAANYIGHYIVPGDWIAHPMEATCSGKRDSDDQNKLVGKRAICHPSEITVSATCDSNRNLEIKLDLGSSTIEGIEKVIYFLE